MNAEKLILTASELQRGDYVNEYGATVASVRESDRHQGVRDVVFSGQAGVFYLHFMEWLHVSRPESGSDAERQDQPGEPPATWDDDSDRW